MFNIVVVILMIGVFLYKAAVFMLSFNWLAPELFNVPEIGYTQVIVIMLLIRLLNTNSSSLADFHYEKTLVDDDTKEQYNIVMPLVVVVVATLVLGLAKMVSIFI